MSMAARSAYQLVDGLLDEGLSFVASYLEKAIQRSIIIVDHNGLIHYPNLPVNSAGIDNVFMQLPASMNSTAYYYMEADKSLTYPIECSGSSAYIIVKNLAPKMLASTLAVLFEAKLAIKCYFSNLNKVDKNGEVLAQKLGDFLFSPTHENIDAILKTSADNLNTQASYHVIIMEFEAEETAIDWQRVGSYCREYLKRSQPDAITLVRSNCLTAIIPAPNSNDTQEPDLDWPRLRSFKESIEDVFKIESSLGIGRSYPLTHIKKSFNEARISLTLPRLMGANSFVQTFSELGLAALIFSQDIEMLKRYCHKTLGKVLNYDRNNHCDLLPTLRQLLDNSFNWKSTADRLFIHINTLYYRVNKIEQLLAIDLSRMDTRVNLYTAIKIWDTLQRNDLTD